MTSAAAPDWPDASRLRAACDAAADFYERALRDSVQARSYMDQRPWSVQLVQQVARRAGLSIADVARVIVDALPSASASPPSSAPKSPRAWGGRLLSSRGPTL